MSGEREPSGTEYGMAAILTYASVYFMSWMITQNPGKKWVVLITYPVYYVGPLYPAYLLASRAKYVHLLIGLKTLFMVGSFQVSVSGCSQEPRALFSSRCYSFVCF